MAIKKKTEIVLDHEFDSRTCRHSLNNHCHVLHCHHFATLYSQLAEDCGMLDGKQLLSEVSEESFYEIFVSYYKENNINNVADKIAIAEQYYSVTGLGQMKVLCASSESGEVELLHSHVDKGWINKWGKRDKPINFITSGYIAGLFAAVFDRPLKSFTVNENASLVTGEEVSRFNVVVN